MKLKQTQGHTECLHSTEIQERKLVLQYVYLNRIELALKKLEESKALIKEAQEIKETKENLEFELIKLKKQRSDSEELIDQAIKEIETLKKNNVKKVITDG